MMNKKSIIAFFLFLPALLFGQDIKIKLLSTNTLATDPGKVSTVVVELSNPTTAEATVTVNFSFPDDWKAFQHDFDLKLNPQQKVKKLVSFVIPHKALAGDYTVTYQATNQVTQNVFFQDKFIFTVRPISRLEIMPLDIQQRAMAGTKISGSFLVKNLSNHKRAIALSSNRGTVKGDKTITLSPYGSQIVEVEATTPIDTKQESRYSFNLIGTIGGDEAIENAYLQTTVLPNSDYFEHERHQLPSYVSINYLQQKNDQRQAAGWQGEFFVQGNLSKSKDRYLEVSLRGPSNQGDSDILLYDEYYATYRTNHLRAKIGDQNFQLSRLTEFSRNARGVGLDFNFLEHSVGAFAVLPRFYPTIKSEIGAYFTHHINDDNAFSFNYLEKRFTGDLGKTSLMSVSGNFSPFKNTYLEAEIASGQGKGREGNAAFFSLDTKLFKRLRLNSTFLVASPHFDGYYSNTKSVSGNINWLITPKLQLFASISQDDRNAALDTLFQAAPYFQREQVGVQMRLNKFTNLQIGARQNTIEDRMLHKLFHREEKLLMARLTNTSRYFTWNLRAEYGRFRSLLKKSELDNQRIFRSMLDLNFNFRFGSLSLFTNYFNESSLILAEQKQLIYGGTFSSRITSTSLLNVTYQNTYAIEDYYKNRNTLSCLFVQRIGKVHQFALNMRQILLRNTLNSKDFSMSLKYTWNFNIPLAKPFPTSSIDGYIFRHKNQPASGIVLTMNEKVAVTDDRGYFQFKNVAAGIHFVLIDKASLALHELPVYDKPYKVEVQPNIDQNFNIELVKTGSLQGAISFVAQQPQPLLINRILMNGYLVQAQKEQELRRTISDENGYFEFQDLRPGVWTIKVLNPIQNKKITLEKYSYQVEINGNEVSTVSIPAKSKKRVIKFKRIMNFSDDDGDGDGK